MTEKNFQEHIHFEFMKQSSHTSLFLCMFSISIVQEDTTSAQTQLIIV